MLFVVGLVVGYLFGKHVGYGYGVDDTVKSIKENERFQEQGSDGITRY